MKIVCTAKMITQKLVLILKVFPSKAIRRWPAIKLAVKRTARAIGRIIFLVISIITIKGINIGGVPVGTRWASIVLVKFIQKNKIIDIQIGIAIAKENLKCALEQNVYGKFLVTLLTIININNEIKIKLEPLIENFLVNKELNSLFNVLVRIEIILVGREYDFQ